MFAYSCVCMWMPEADTDVSFDNSPLYLLRQDLFPKSEFISFGSFILQACPGDTLSLCLLGFM